MGSKLFRRVLFGVIALLMFAMAFHDYRASEDVSRAALPAVLGVVFSFVAITAKGG